MDRIRLALPLVAGAVLVLAACGGSGATVTPTPANGPTSAPATDAPDPGGQPTDEPANPPAGGVTDACALVTAEEWATVTGLGVTAAEPVPMSEPMVGCLYQDADGAVGIVSVTPGGAPLWQIYNTGDLTEVPGVGNGALWDESTAGLIVLAGDSLLSVSAGTGADDIASRLEWAKQLATIAVSRM